MKSDKFHQCSEYHRTTAGDRHFMRIWAYLRDPHYQAQLVSWSRITKWRKWDKLPCCCSPLILSHSSWNPQPDRNNMKSEYGRRAEVNYSFFTMATWRLNQKPVVVSGSVKITICTWPKAAGETWGPSLSTRRRWSLWSKQTRTSFFKDWNSRAYWSPDSSASFYSIFESFGVIPYSDWFLWGVWHMHLVFDKM